MLCLHVELITGRYVATATHDRGAAEWPPHPARLFSALVASLPRAEAALDPGAEARARAALLAVEALPAPTVWATEATMRAAVPVFVPVADVHLVADTDALELEAERAEAEAAGAAALGKAAAAKAAKAARKKLDEAIARSLEAPAKPKREEVRLASTRFDAWGLRKPRQFPSVTPTSPSVWLCWPGAPFSEADREALDVVCARVHRLGHSSSLVSVRALLLPDDAPGPSPDHVQWVPAEGDAEQVMRTPGPGQLVRLEAEYAVHQETEPRVLPARAQAYVRAGAPCAQPPPAGDFSSDAAEWIVLQRRAGPRLPLTAAVGLASALRGLLLRLAGTPSPRLLSGHHPEGAPDDAPHLAIVPLPFVGRAHADGTLQGVALIPPRGLDDAQREALLDAVAAWIERDQAKEGSDAALCLGLRGAGELQLALRAADEAPHSLQAATWARPSRSWATVTPIALDRNPGNLDAERDAERRAHRSGEPDPEGRARAARAEANAVAQITAALTRQGLPAPSAVELSWQSPIVGAPPVRDFPAFPPKEGRVRRVKVHARIVFDEPVAGPLLLGAGRYYGLGLCRPLFDDTHRNPTAE
jgi:CRISPR-associated protein Csb2